MNGEDAEFDELFARDADSRLLDRRRQELGLAPHAPPTASTPLSFGAESIVDDHSPPSRRASAMLRVELEARPMRELIPGAIVTVVVTVHDHGASAADDVLLRIAAPDDAEPIADSFVRDGMPIDGVALLGEGLRIGTVPAGGAVRVRFALRVLPGTDALDVIAHAAAPGVPTIAAPALRLPRRAGHAAYDAPRPFFELELGEDDDILADDGIEPKPTPTPPRPTTIDTVVGEVLPPAPVVREPPPPIVREAPPIVVREPPRIAPIPALVPLAQTEPTQALVRAIDAGEIHALERVFAGALPHGLAAVALLSAIACADGPLGEAHGLDTFARSVSAALPRALVSARMHRVTPPVVTREALDAIRPDGEAVDAPFASSGPTLVARLHARELTALRAVLARDLADPFVRGAQVLLAIAPHALDGVADTLAVRVRNALGAYRVAGGAWIMRVTVRRAVDKRYDPLTADDATLHDAGRALVAALREAIPS